MLDSGSHSGNCFKKWYFLNKGKIGSSPLENFMLFDGNSGVEISSLNSWQFVSLSIENVVMGIRNSRLNMHLYFLFHLLHSSSLTTFTFVFLLHYLSFSSAFVALDLRLGDHPWSNLNHLNSYSMTLAVFAFDCITTTLSLTIWADSIPGYGYLFDYSCENLLEGHFDWDKFGLHFLGSVVFLPPVEEIKDVASHAGGSSIFDSLLAILIVELSFFRVR